MVVPKLDRRTIGEIEATAEALARSAYTPEWTGVGKPEDPGRQLVGLFARMMELLIERVNRVPEKNFVEFLDMVGVEPSPGSPAAVPVTFLPSKKAQAGGEVPSGTQVATTQTETADAQIFETRNAFFATPAKLLATVNLTPGAEAYSILPESELPPTPEAIEADPTAATMLNGSEPTLVPVDHVLYLAHPTLFARAEPVDVTLTFTLTGNQTAIFDDAHLEWRMFSAEAKDWIKIPADEANGSLTYSFPSPKIVEVTLPGLEGAAPIKVGDIEAVWLACHFKSAANTSLSLPTISSIAGKIAPPRVNGSPAQETDTTIQLAFINTVSLDSSKPVFPFGERPKYGDAFYLGHDLAFAPDVEHVTLRFKVRNYSNAELAAMFTGIRFDETITTEVEWQYLRADGEWKPLPGASTFTHVINITAGASHNDAPGITRDNTGASDHGCLLGSDTNANVALDFDIPDTIGLNKVGDRESYWLRAIVRNANPYGKDGFLVIWPGAPDTFVFVGPTFIPPIIESATITYRYRSGAVVVEQVQTLNNFHLVNQADTLSGTGPGLRPFIRITEPTATAVASFDGDPAVYLGFDRKFDNIFVSMFLHVEEVFDAEQPQLESGAPQIIWEYLAEGMVWKPLDVTDDTGHLTSSGIVAFQAPIDSAAASLFPQLTIEMAFDTAQYWYRARLGTGSYDYPPRLRFVLLNSVMADNHATVGNVVVGSGNGEPSQHVTLVQAPVLAGELWVREPELPSAEEMAVLESELARLHREAGEAGPPPNSIDVAEPEAEGEEPEIWVRWIRKANFLSSAPNSRHYTLETTTGVLTFGDGTRGLIPPIAKDNIAMRNLRKGGGEAANQAATPLAVKELKTSLPFIDKIFNIQGATGGSNPWDRARTIALGPQLIKNKDRAVTTEDYEWLVRAAFSQVARVRCLATRSPAPGGGLAFTPGAVTIMIVPKGSERTPQPPKGLLKKITEYLRDKTFGNIVAEIHAIAPEYQLVRVAAEIRTLRPEDSSLVARRAVRALEDFLHPLTGGEDAAGWAFGRPVYRSEVFAVLQAVDGVDYVADARFIDLPAAESFPVGEHALVASGGHEIGVI